MSKWSYSALLMAIFIVCNANLPAAHAQTLGLTAKPATSETTLPSATNELSEDQIYRLLSRLDEKQVRELLLKRLVDDAKKREAAQSSRNARTLDQMAREYAVAFGTFISDVIVKSPAIPVGIARAFGNYQDRRGDATVWRQIWVIAACIGLGMALAYWLGHALTSLRARIRQLVPDGTWARVKWLCLRFAIQGASLVVFVVAAQLLNIWLNSGIAADRETLARIIYAIGWTWFAILLARFMLSPTDPSLRLCNTDDATAALLTWRVGLIAAISNFGFGFVTWMVHFGVPFDETWIGFWVNLAFHLAVALTIWQARSGITAMLEETEGPSLSPRLFAVWWPTISIGLLAVHWLVIELVVATSNVPPALFVAMTGTMALIMGLPILLHGTQASIAGLFPVDDTKDRALQAADQQTQLGLVRIGKVVLAIAAGLLVLSLWSVDIVRLAEQGVGARYASAIIEISLIMIVAYGLWELLRIVTDRQIAYEQVALGIDPDGGDKADGEIGGAGARLGTLLPLVRVSGQVAIVILAGLAVLGELGVNILPLLAGAGIVGLAIGFGAQTLVKDIISGIFFLVDDAFRKGEYIDIGDVKGTVERISIRSMQLRHHNGPLNTVPFGDIRHVTNFSRDWVMMKLPLRLTYDTDAEKVRKMIKKLGQELLEDPAIGHQFLQPLKSQGVIQMEDSAQIMRVKFMTKPGDQWTIRRIVFARIRELFEQNGIKFANREVTVRIADEDRSRSLDREQREAVAGSAARVLQDTDAPAGR